MISAPCIAATAMSQTIIGASQIISGRFDINIVTSFGITPDHVGDGRTYEAGSSAALRISILVVVGGIRLLVNSIRT